MDPDPDSAPDSAPDLAIFVIYFQEANKKKLRHRSADPDLHQNLMDPEQWFL